MIRVNKQTAHAIAAVAVILCVVAAGMYVTEPEEMPEADDPLGFPWMIAAYLIMAFQLGVIAYLLNDHASIAATTEQLRADARNSEALAIQANLHFLQSLMSERTLAGSNSIKYISTFAERQAEVIVSSLWSPEVIFSVDEILALSRVYERLSAEVAISTFYMSKTFDPYTELINGWNAAGDASATFGAGKMQVGFTWQQGNSVQSTYSPYVQYGLGTTVTSYTASKVYLDPQQDMGDHSAFLYVDGGSALIVSAEDENYSYGLVPGFNDISDILPGVYYLQTGRSYVGSLFPIVDVGSADVVPAAALITGPDMIYAFQAGAGVDILQNGIKTNSSMLTYTIAYDGKTQTVDLIPSFAAIYRVMTECIDVAVRAGIAAQAQWTLFDMAGESLQYISVSSIVPDLMSLTLSPAELAMFSAAALIQIADFIQRNQMNITEADIFISSNSMQVVCFGEIRDNFGNVIATDVAFTPLNWIRDIRLTKGVISWNQPGVAAVWGSADGFEGASGIPDPVTLLPGYVLVIDELLVLGVPASHFVLQVIPLPKLMDPDWVPHPTAKAPPDLVSAATIVQVLFVLFGLMIAAASIMPSNKLFFIIGLLIAVVGYFASGLIASIFWGVPPWWWPF